MNARLRSRVLSVSAAPLLLLCGGCSEDEGTPVVENDVGTLCIFAEAPAGDSPGDVEQDFRAGQAVYFRVEVQDCSGPCGAVDLRLKCGATLRSSTITVSSEYSYVQMEQEQDCPTICGPNTVATCLIGGGLNEGSFTVSFGDEQRALDVPSVVPACL